MADGLSEKQIAEIKDAFSLFDKDGNGSITADEMGTVIRAMGQNPTKAQIKQMISDADCDNTGKIEFSEFCNLMAKNYHSQEVEQEEMLQAFKVFDKDQSGYVTKGELRKIMTELGEKMTEDEVDQMMRDADVDGDGRINYEEFVKVMTCT